MRVEFAQRVDVGGASGAPLEQRHLLPKEWREVTGTSDMTLYVTPEEMRALDEEIVEILFRYRDRIANPSKRPEGSRPIEFAGLAYPIDL